MAKAMVVDAVAGAMIEAVCDEAERRINSLTGGKINTFRFGLGYGDLPLEQEQEFLDILDAGRKAGVYSTESFALVPTKSVACVIGLGKR